MLRPILVALLFVLVILPAHGQKKYNTDSLWKVHSNNAVSDTLRLDALYKLSQTVIANNPDSAMVLCDSVFAYAQRVNSPHFLGLACHSRGIIYKVTGRYSMAIREYFEALKYWSVTNEAEHLAQCHQNIANVYGRLDQVDKALMHYDTSIAMVHQLGDEEGLGSIYNDMGNMYITLQDDSQALFYLEKALEIRQRLGNERGSALTSHNISGVYLMRFQPEKAIEYEHPFYTYAVNHDRQAYLISSLTSYGEAYLMKGEFERGRDSCLRALEKNIDFKSVERELYACECLYKAYDSLDQPVSALMYYRRFITARDSLQNQSQRDEVTRLEYEYQYLQKTIADSLETAQRFEIIAAKAEGERKLRYSLFAGLGLTVIFGLVMFNRFRTTRRQKNLIAKQQEETQLQKRLIEEKNKEITDSINYAQRIQGAILPSEQELKKSFPDIFVLFRPRDIVSGDFYWYDENKISKLIALADCTGHGVPGGFMSMLGYEILQDVVMQDEVSSTSEALKRLDQKVTQTLNKNDKAYRDGMDLALCSFPKNKMELHFSGANRPLLHFSDGVMKIYKPDKHTIGGAIDDTKKEFTMHVIPLKQGDMIYLFSDGYADQFGGPEGKKFMSRKLEQLLDSVATLECIQQKEKLERAFNDWKGTLEQVDDVCILGIRI